MIKTKDIMTKNPVTVSPDTEITKAAELLITNKFNGLPVVEKDMLVGIVGKEDVLKTIIPNEDKKD